MSAMTTTQPRRSAGSRFLSLGTGSLMAFMLYGCLLGILLLADPFKLRLLGRLNGSFDAAAEAMPSNTRVYLGVNLLNARPRQLISLADKLSDLTGTGQGGGNLSSLAGLLALTPFGDRVTGQSLSNPEISELLSALSGSGLGVDDVIPWAGQYVGVGFTDWQVDSSGTVQKMGVVVSVEARDPNAADQFLQKLAGKMESNTGGRFSTTDWLGVKIFAMDNGETSLAFCRSGSVVLMATNPDDLKRSIDTQGQNSLGQSKNYQNLIQKLPANRAVTLYIDSSTFPLPETPSYNANMLTPLMSIANVGGLSDAWVDSVIGLSVVDAGLKMDIITRYDPVRLTDAQKLMFSNLAGAAKVPGTLPATTLAYFSGQDAASMWRNFYQSLGGSTVDYDQAMSDAKTSIGVNPDQDVFKYLDGEWALGIVAQSQTSSLPGLSNVGLVGVFESTQAGMLNKASDEFLGTAENNGMVINQSVVGKMRLFELMSNGNSAVAYGITDTALSFSTDAALLRSMAGSNAGSLSTQVRYQKTMSQFSGAEPPAIFVDVEGLLAALRSQAQTDADRSNFDQSTASFSMFSTLAFSKSAPASGLLKNTLVILLKP